MKSAAESRTRRFIVLGDGRKLCYAEYGDPEGFPVFLFHGTPGSRLWYADDSHNARAIGLRLIAPDRPGYGLSDPKPGRTILDYADDIKELADQLNVDRFSVMGVSGGGVYAAACAYCMPERVEVAGLVATINMFKNRRAPKGMCRSNRMFFWLSGKWPALLRYSYKYQRAMIYKKPDKFVKGTQSNMSHLCESDRKVVLSAGFADFYLLHMKTAFEYSAYEVVREAAMLSGDWGFDSSQIKTKVVIWHGTDDTLAPIEPIRELADLLPDCNAHFIQGKGHFLGADEGEEESMIWRSLLSPEQLPV
ncbi:alpha/beta hydrolase [Fulvivirga kasyanovii]|uniref:Alpha/beta hydrolase n=1 Tax=Fulvivirga kasyanovii TaxID=396812 RepID=A0ABW9RXZ9_9BACT|nr:alpha/beta hydrolase [Fulvivirga kasyanovii]MTI29129.1 alpha/beta hydrolase [Fulvivirga kasyanovii]